MALAPEPQILSVALAVPPPWFDAARALSAALFAAFPELPPLVAPHISLRHSFRTAEPERAARAVARALRGMRPTMIAVEEVEAFLASDGSVEVVYLAVGGAWPRLAHQRIVRETETVALQPPAGAPDFELAGFRPHITLAVPRDLPGVRERRAAVLGHARELWPGLRPGGRGFLATEVTLSRWRSEGEGAMLARFYLG